MKSSDMGGPRLTATGQDAAKAVSELLRAARPVGVNSESGRIELRPGAVWGRTKLLACPSENYVWYSDGESFYECPTGAFVRDEWLPALHSGGAGVVHLTPGEIEVVSHFFLSWHLFLHLSAARVALLYNRNRSLMEVALRQTPPVLRMLNVLGRAYPALFAKLASSEAEFVLSAIRADGSTASSASFLARALKCVGGFPEHTLGKVLRVAARISALKVAERGAASEESARALTACLAEEGIVVREQEASRVVEEFGAQEHSASAMSELAMTCQMLVPTLNHLAYVVQSSG